MKKTVVKVLLLIINIALLIFGAFAPVSQTAETAAIAAALLISAAAIIYEVAAAERKRETALGRIFALIASVGFFLVGEHIQAGVAAIIFVAFVWIENFFQEKADFENSKIDEIFPEKVIVFRNGKETEEEAAVLEKGNIVVVGNGEKVPADGMVFLGASALDASSFSGGKSKYKVKKGDVVYGGSINLGDSIQVEITKPLNESFIYKVIENTKEAARSKSYLEEKNFMAVTVLRSIFVASAVCVALIPPLGFGEDYLPWGCAGLIIAAGAAFDAPAKIIRKKISDCMYSLFRKGITVKDAKTLEDADKAERVVLERELKREEGTYTISYIKNVDCSKEEVITFAAHMCAFGDDPASKAIVNGFIQVARYEGVLDENPIKKERISAFERIEEKGFSGYLGNRFVCVGNEEIMKLLNITDLEKSDEYTLVHVACDQKYMGYLALKYDQKDGAEKIYQSWADAGISKYAVCGLDFSEIYTEICQDKEAGEKVFVVERAASDISKEYKGEYEKDVLKVAVSPVNVLEFAEDAAFNVATGDMAAVANIKNAAKSCIKGCRIKNLVSIIATAVIFIGTAVIGLPLGLAFAVDGIIKVVLIAKG